MAVSPVSRESASPASIAASQNPRSMWVGEVVRDVDSGEQGVIETWVTGPTADGRPYGVRLDGGEKVWRRQDELWKK
jgi:hypothetical protein